MVVVGAINKVALCREQGRETGPTNGSALADELSHYLRAAEESVALEGSGCGLASEQLGLRYWRARVGE